jgi:GntR family transcriptional repressor for pyruvate dehydrogenase complex
MKSAQTKPIERTTLSAAAFEHLITNVVHGRWRAGEKIPPERVLCQQLGIARNSLREALKAMELIGMLESRVGEGTFISPRSEFLSRPLLWAFTGTDHAELADLMEARALMESELAGLAAKRATSVELDQIKQTLTAMSECILARESVLEADLAFHFTVAKAAHNEVLANAAQLLRNVMKYWIHLKLMMGHVPERALARHREIYEAICDRDIDLSRALMHDHLDETTKLITQIVAGKSSTGLLPQQPRKKKSLEQSKAPEKPVKSAPKRVGSRNRNNLLLR